MYNNLTERKTLNSYRVKWRYVSFKSYIVKLFYNIYIFLRYIFFNRSQVQGSTFRVKGKEGIEVPKSSLNMIIFQSNFQFNSKFWIKSAENDAFLINRRFIFSPGTKMEPLNL